MSETLQLPNKVIAGTAGEGPHLLITAGVHGDEFEPIVTVRRLIKSLSPDEIKGRVTLVPVVNEPAFRRCARAAEDELDLARTCPGDQTVHHRAHRDALSKLIRTADFYIDLHTGGTPKAPPGNPPAADRFRLIRELSRDPRDDR